jgi:diguanylate cyclase (GGDEF)-like protein
MRQLTVPVQAGSDVSMARWTVLAGALLVTTATTSFTATRMGSALVFATALPVPLLVLWRLRRVLLSRQEATHRAQLESARSALVARLAADAVTVDIATVRQAACRALAAELQCPVRLVPPDTVSASSGDVVAVGVGAAEEPSQVLEVHLAPGGAWSLSDDSVVHSVASVLGAAEARHRSEQRVRWAASHDTLTELMNRGSFMTALADAVAGAPPGAVAVLFLDLDDFKQINDTYGHTAGDAVLVTTARRLSDACRAGDLVARLGGDEFVLLCRSASDAAAAFGLATRVRDAVTQPIPTPVGEVRVGASIGIATNRKADMPEDVLRRADERMYQTKHWLPKPARA